jgi:hypothetical protein
MHSRRVRCGSSTHKTAISNIPGLVALTCDGWSSRVFRGYFVVTIHWITLTFDIQSLVLEFLHFPPPHDQHNTRDILLNIINDYKLGPRVRAVTTDSGSEMPPAIRQVREYLNEQFCQDLGNDFHIRCGCHIIDRAVITKFAGFAQRNKVEQHYSTEIQEYASPSWKGTFARCPWSRR